MKVKYVALRSRYEGALWRDLAGVTHTFRGWDLMTYEQITQCGRIVRRRRGDWLYDLLRLSPKHPNCITCAQRRQ